MKYALLFIVLFTIGTGFSQTIDSLDQSELYKQYREDQFYISFTYNLLTNKPTDVSQNGFSSGLHLGFIRDMPINKARNRAVGLGLGLSANAFNQNMQISEINDTFRYRILDNTTPNVSKNKFSTYIIELPLEFRWRTSTPTTFNFWRIYAGFKLGYVFYNSTTYRGDDGNENLSNIDDFNKFQYGPTLSVGYGSWSFHAYYGLNPIFNNAAQLNSEAIVMKFLKLGLIFYIL